MPGEIFSLCHDFRPPPLTSMQLISRSYPPRFWRFQYAYGKFIVAITSKSLQSHLVPHSDASSIRNGFASDPQF